MFQVLLMEIPGTNLFYSVWIFHNVGDANTSYHFLVNPLFNVRVEAKDGIHKIDWIAPYRKTQELIQDHMSPRDANRLNRIPFVLCVIPRSVRGMGHYSYILMIQSKIDQKKEDLKSSHEIWQDPAQDVP